MTYLTLCHFDGSGKLSSRAADISLTPYIAISHVWGRVSWRRVAGIEQMVLVSSQKARFLEEELPALMGNNLFWMDVLAIDQKNEAARLDMVKNAPTIYGNAQKTIIVREDGGFKQCCSDAMLTFLAGSFRTPPNEVPKEWVQRHMDKHNLKFDEVWLSRVWPQQEALWSNTVQFTVCCKTEAETSEEESAMTMMEDRPWLMKPTTMQTFEDLKSLAEAWVCRGHFSDKPSGICPLWQVVQYQEKHATEFVKAFLSNGTVRREKATTSRTRPLDDWLLDITSHRTRQATEPRDYILVLFVDQEWYEVPTEIAHMSFGDAFVNFLQQYRQAGIQSQHNIFPKIHAGVIEPFLHASRHHQLPCHNLPEPLCLQDFCDLFNSQSVDSPELSLYQHEWDIADTTEKDSLEQILNAISDTFSMVDMGLFVGWLTQYHSLAQNLERLFSLRDELQKSDHQLVAGEREVLEMLQEMIPLMTTGSLGGIVKIILTSHARLRKQVPPLFASETSSLNSINSNTNVRQESALAEINNDFIREWYILMQILEYNMEPLKRKSLWDVAASFACGLPISSLRWSRKHLRPYVLRSRGAILVPNQARNQHCSLICLGSPALDIRDLYNIKIGTYGLPVVTARSRKHSSMGVQIIGMAPLMRDNIPEGYTVLFDRARPVILPLRPEPLSQALEEENETNYRALRHWDAMFEDGLWGPNPRPRPGRATAPMAANRPGPVRYGSPGATLEELSTHETDDQDPYAYYPGTRHHVPFTQRIIFYSMSQWQKYTQPPQSSASPHRYIGSPISSQEIFTQPQQRANAVSTLPIRGHPPPPTQSREMGSGYQLRLPSPQVPVPSYPTDGQSGSAHGDLRDGMKPNVF